MKAMLAEIVRTKRAEIEALPNDAGPAEAPPLRDFAAALRRPGLSVIAEIKRRSPSAGALRDDLDAEALARAYARGGAAAISCLTDGPHFGARPDDLPRARAATTLPLLRKDFILDLRQVRQSRRLGADAVLLIARLLSVPQLTDLLAAARALRMAALVEVHDEAELDRALACGAEIIGVNNRDLDTFRVSRDTALRLRPRIPPDRIAVAESGISRREDLLRIERCGYDAVLVGEALIRAADPCAGLRALAGSRA